MYKDGVEFYDCDKAEKTRQIVQIVVEQFLRACSESRRVRMAPSDFSPDEGNFAPPYCRIASKIHEIWRKEIPASKGSVRDVREGILNRL